MKDVSAGQAIAIAQSVLAFAACVGYAFAGDARHVVYWMAAAAITLAVTL